MNVVDRLEHDSFSFCSPYFYLAYPWFGLCSIEIICRRHTKEGQDSHLFTSHLLSSEKNVPFCGRLLYSE